MQHMTKVSISIAAATLLSLISLEAQQQPASGGRTIEAAGKHDWQGQTNKGPDSASRSGSVVPRPFTSPEEVFLYEVHRDGRFATAVDWSGEGPGDLVLQELSTAALRRVPVRPAETVDTLDCPVLSPDEKQIAYTQYNKPGQASFVELWVISTHSESKPRLLASDPKAQHLCASAWSPDGKSVVARLVYRDGAQQIVWVSLSDGSMRAVKSFPADRRVDRKIRVSPDGRLIAYTAAPAPHSQQSSVYVMSRDGSFENSILPPSSYAGNVEWSPDGERVLFVAGQTGNLDLWSMPVRRGQANG